MLRWIVTLGLGSLSVPDLVVYIRSIITAMGGNANFPSPPFPLGNLTTANNDLEDAWQASQNENSGKDETAAVRVKRFNVVTLINFLAGYVEFVANEDHENGDTIIFSANMGLRDSPSNTGRTFTARRGETSGTADLATRRVRNASYDWQYTTTPEDDESWITVPSTRQASTTIEDLVPVTRYYFRVRANTTETGPWQGPVNLVVA